MSKPRSFAPIIAAVLLLLPVLYVGSYLVMVKPSGVVERSIYGNDNRYPSRHYGGGYEMEYFASTLFYPLEEIDRRLRPGAWDPLEIETLPFGGTETD